MKKWVRVDSRSASDATDVGAKPAYAYSRYNGTDLDKQDVLVGQLRDMTRAHNSASASNRVIRNSFYGTKD